MTSGIEIKGLTKRFSQNVAVDHLNLDIKGKSLFALLGVNGAGKTTLIKMLCCLSRPDEGDAFIHGKSIRSESMQVKKIINISPQETAIAPLLTVRENLEFSVGIYGHPHSECRALADGMINEMSLKEVEKKTARTLSGGWQRRLSIAMALITSPKVLFLDEPTLGLDVIARRELWNVIQSLRSRMTIILTTHYLEEAEAIADRIGIMAEGKLKAVGTADELRQMAGKQNFEDAFIAIAKGEIR
jgi:ABC-2 type transport system ATP-binding protein